MRGVVSFLSGTYCSCHCRAVQRPCELFCGVCRGQDKDVFRDVYRSLLAKRLLLQKSFSPDAERNAISLLKHACGPQYTYRIDGMITDLAVAKDLDKVPEYCCSLCVSRPKQQSSNCCVIRTQLYHERATLLDRDCEFHSYVLKTGYWPGFHLLQNVTLPTEMMKCVTNFQNYYTSREPAKKVRYFAPGLPTGVPKHPMLFRAHQLTWVWSQGTSTLRVTFNDQWRDVVVTSLQAMVVLWFNTHSGITVSDLATLTGIEKGNLKRIIAPMCCAKGFKILKKTPPAPTIKDDDTLEFDYAFRHPKRACVFATR
jgi:hypothetical protein